METFVVLYPHCAQGELVEELGHLVQWLAHNGYKPVGAEL